MQVTRDHINDAVKRFLAKGGEIKKIDQIAGEPVLGKDYLLSEEILDMVEIDEPDLIQILIYIFLPTGVFKNNTPASLFQVDNLYRPDGQAPATLRIEYKTNGLGPKFALVMVPFQ